MRQYFNPTVCQAITILFLLISFSQNYVIYAHVRKEAGFDDRCEEVRKKSSRRRRRGTGKEERREGKEESTATLSKPLWSLTGKTQHPHGHPGHFLRLVFRWWVTQHDFHRFVPFAKVRVLSALERVGTNTRWQEVYGCFRAVCECDVTCLLSVDLRDTQGWSASLRVSPWTYTLHKGKLKFHVALFCI